MFIVFGTKVLKKKYGFTPTNYICSHCNNENPLMYVSFWRFFSLFWIPIIPISTKKYYKVCPVCSTMYPATNEEIQALQNT